MRVANEVSARGLDLVIGQFVEDFQDIIRRQVEHAVKKALGNGPRKATRKRAASENTRVSKKAPPVKAKSRRAASSTAERAKSAAEAPRKNRKRGAPPPGQLSLF